MQWDSFLIRIYNRIVIHPIIVSSNLPSSSFAGRMPN
jgi:hypothetical protein